MPQDIVLSNMDQTPGAKHFPNPNGIAPLADTDPPPYDQRLGGGATMQVGPYKGGTGMDSSLGAKAGFLPAGAKSAPAGKPVLMVDQGGQEYDIPPDKIKDAVSLGLRPKKGAEPTTPFLNYLQRNAPKGGEKGDTFGSVLNRELDAFGEGILGMPKAVKESFTQDPTKEEQKTYGVGEHPGMLEKAAVGIGRNIGEPLSNAAMWYGSEFRSQKVNDRQGISTVDKMMTVLPEALGTAGSAVVLSKLADTIGAKGVDSLEKIKSGSHAGVLKELEQFRRNISEKPTRSGRIVAGVKHAALKQRIDTEWSSVYKAMDFKPTDGEAIKDVLRPLAKADPPTAAWLEKHIVESQSGGSTTVPVWKDVRALSAKLNRMSKNPNLDPVVRAEIPKAIEGLEKVATDAAGKAGVADQYSRVKKLNRAMENVKFHTGHGARKVTPSGLYGLGGMAAGGVLSGAGGLFEGLGGMFLGHQAGELLGKVATPKNAYEIPTKSILGEKSIWELLGEKPPEGTGKSRIKPFEDTPPAAPKASGGGTPPPKGGAGSRPSASGRTEGDAAKAAEKITIQQASVDSLKALHEGATSNSEKIKIVKRLREAQDKLYEMQNPTASKVGGVDEEAVMRAQTRKMDQPRGGQPAANTQEATNWHGKALAKAKELLGANANISDILRKAAEIQQAGPEALE